MLIGIPTEIKAQEYRVAATPAGVRELVRAGHTVRVQAGAGAAVGFADADYAAAGAQMVPDAAAVYEAELVFKVKEPQPPEYALMRAGQWLFCYLHLAAAPGLAHILLERGVNAIAFETVEDARGATPLLAPMSQIAGRLAVQAGMQALEMKNGGRGVLLSGVPGVAPARVVVIGGGQVGANAVRLAVGLGAQVTLLERSHEKLQRYDELYPGRLQTRYAHAANLEECVAQADLVIGAVYVHGRRAPRLIDRALLRRMPRGAALVDVAIDQGGIAETSRPSTHAEPFYVEEGVVHYCVPNMPGAVARTATLALAEVTLPHLLRLAAGPRAALEQDAGLALGLNVAAGRVTHPGLAQDLGVAVADWRAVLP
ncbi:MAG: alanine dehydrogenase [Thiobacillaceae bacterium]|nr:alanine dehydrogenase [Thiobacillaceae bacterium]MDW8324621.1 alanine dehydrogenase [Burkholderiales bacterium]